MKTDIKADSDTLKQLSRNMIDRTKAMDAALSGMRSGVEELNRTWEGSNHEKFTGQFEIVMEQMEKINKLLYSYSDTIRLAASGYDQTEQEVTGLIR